MPAMQPYTKAVQSTRLVKKLCFSIMMPNRFMVALSAKIKRIAPRSHSPVSMPISTIIRLELSAYS